MATLLARNAHIVVTMDDQRREIRNGGIFAKDGFIVQVGKVEELPQTADAILDLTDHVVLPGLINTHHHFYQTLTRVLPHAQDVNLFNWLKTLYPIWARMSPEDIFVSTQTALIELALSGCTTASDHLYIFPNGSKLDDEICAAREIGLRLHASRGSMSLGESKGGLPPDEVVDPEEKILNDSQRLIQQYHDPKPGSMLQIVLAPCSPFSVTGNLMIESAALAREYGVNLHTHLAETQDEENFCLQKFGYRPLGYMQSLNWTGNDVWFAHCVYANENEIKTLSQTGCGVAHCPSSNMRLASGIAPVMKYLKAGVQVGLGVDGSASNDSSNMLAEVRQAMLLARLNSGICGASLSSSQSSDLMTARKALELSTLGGAAVLGRTDIGSLQSGKCADFIAINLNRVGFAGGLSDPVSAIVFCSSPTVDLNVVNGEIIVENGQFTKLDVASHIIRHNTATKKLLE